MSDFDLDAEPTKFPFGQHAGKTFDEVPRNYKLWILTQGMERRHPKLYAELVKHTADLLKAEARAADVAAYHAGIKQIERMASGEDLV